MMTKSIRLTNSDSLFLADIVLKDQRIERGPSEAIRLCFEDAAKNIPSWKEVGEKAKKFKKNDAENTESTFETRTFKVEEKVFKMVRDSINNQLGLSKPRISFITRLCIYNAWLKLHKGVDDEEPINIEVKNVDAVDLFIRVSNRTAELFREGRISDIKKYLEES